MCEDSRLLAKKNHAGERAASAKDDIRRNQRRISVAESAFEAGPEPVKT